MTPRKGFFDFLKYPNIVIDILPPIPCLEKFWFSSYGLKCFRLIKLQDSLKCNIPRKKSIMKFIFCMQIDIDVFYKLILSFWVCVAIHTPSTQNKKFSYLCNNFRKVWGTKLIFCLSDKHKKFLQVDTVCLGVLSQACPKYPK